MLTPEQLDTIPDEMDQMFRELDDYIVSRYAKVISEAGEITEEALWLEQRAELLGLAVEDIQMEVARVLDLSDESIHELFGDVAFTSADADRKRFESAGLDAKRITDSEFLSQYVEAAYKQTNGQFKNFGKTMGFVENGKVTNLYDYMMHELDQTQMLVSTGVVDYNTAIRNAVNKISQNGVSVMMYDSGYRMNIASAARMITLTGVNQMSRWLNDGICDELGLDLVEVSAHAGARPSHQEWQGEIYSRSGLSAVYPDLVESTGLGSVDGLCGANCRHNYYGYYEGSPRTYTKEQLANIDPDPFEYEGREYTYYEANQRMRYMERQMRKTQRRKAGYREANLEDDYHASAIKLRRQENEYIKFSKAANTRPRFELVN